MVLASGRGTKTGALSRAGAEGDPAAGDVARRPEQAARVTARASRRTRGGIAEDRRRKTEGRNVRRSECQKVGTPEGFPTC